MNILERIDNKTTAIKNGIIALSEVDTDVKFLVDSDVKIFEYFADFRYTHEDSFLYMIKFFENFMLAKRNGHITYGIYNKRPFCVFQHKEDISYDFISGKVLTFAEIYKNDKIVYLDSFGQFIEKVKEHIEASVE